MRHGGAGIHLRHRALGGSAIALLAAFTAADLYANNGPNESTALPPAEFDILREVFADPAACDIDAIFCETHERESYPEFKEIDRMRRASETLTRPYVNLYWP